MMEKKAEETQMEIDTESSISAGKIKDLIAEAVKKACKKQDGEIQKLTATIKRSNPKNSQRGAILPTKKTQRASSTKKQEGKQDGKSDPKKKKEKEPSRGRKGNDSPKGKTKSKKQSGPNKSRQNSNSSRRPTSRL
jgi:DNA mismatch repair ATPase MutL